MTPRKILIVDDEMDMRIFMSALFKTAGHSPIAVSNGVDGLRKAKAEKPDLIILDVMMPEQGGALMYRNLKQEDGLKNIPVIMLSGVKKESFFHYLKMVNIQSDEAIREPDAYLEKPPEPEILLQTARNLFKQ